MWVFLKAKERETDDLLFRRWVVWAQNEMSFEEFKRKLTPQVPRSAHDIIREVNGYIDTINKGFRKVEL